jgi:competence ComEA-like helix-hairpin-helix protein
MIVEPRAQIAKFQLLWLYGLLVVIVNYLSGQGMMLGDNLQDDVYDNLKPMPAHLAPLIFQPININEANEELLMTISGVGPKLSSRIIASRKSEGFFTKPEDILRVKGIGPKTLHKIKKYISVSTQ